MQVGIFLPRQAAGAAVAVSSGGPLSDVFHKVVGSLTGGCHAAIPGGWDCKTDDGLIVPNLTGLEYVVHCVSAALALTTDKNITPIPISILRAGQQIC